MFSSVIRNVSLMLPFAQIRGPLSSLRTLSKMLSNHVKRNEAGIYAF